MVLFNTGISDTCAFFHSLCEGLQHMLFECPTQTNLSGMQYYPSLLLILSSSQQTFTTFFLAYSIREPLSETPLLVPCPYYLLFGVLTDVKHLMRTLCRWRCSLKKCLLHSTVWITIKSIPLTTTCDLLFIYLINQFLHPLISSPSSLFYLPR